MTMQKVQLCFGVSLKNSGVSGKKMPHFSRVDQQVNCKSLFYKFQQQPGNLFMAN